VSEADDDDDDDDDDDGFTVHCGIITAAVQWCHYRVSLCSLLSKSLLSSIFTHFVSPAIIQPS